MNALLHVSFNDKSKYDFERTSFEYPSLFLVLRGEFVYKLPDSKPVRVSAGCGVLFPAGVVIEKKVLSALRMHLITYNGADELSDTFLPFHADVCRPFPLAGRTNEDTAILDRAYFGYKTHLQPYERHLCEDLLYEILRIRPQNEKSLLAGRIRAYIEQNLAEPLDIQELAHRFGYSYTGFLKFFKAQFRQAPCRYIEQRRLEKAAVLLTFSECSVRDASAACGFDNEFYFSRRFAAFHGMPPSRFRKQNRTL